ncbi:hypothetical protein NDU88_005744 [Pleurodeles waltl]|uniref:Uncharacterized protein n=1 Tax=Pleurodeles waltl TaxID=8319 RepID=A0AAV7TBL3_PLEWA|nr:hypothetical protein NDU88_005744 [Pleurodeles waltl]
MCRSVRKATGTASRTPAQGASDTEIGRRCTGRRPSRGLKGPDRRREHPDAGARPTRRSRRFGTSCAESTLQGATRGDPAGRSARNLADRTRRDCGETRDLKRRACGGIRALLGPSASRKKTAPGQEGLPRLGSLPECQARSGTQGPCSTADFGTTRLCNIGRKEGALEVCCGLRHRKK